MLDVVISGISKSTSVLTAFNVLLKSISSSIVKESGGNCPKLLEIFRRELACARRPVGLRSSNFLGFLGFLYLTSLYGIVSEAAFEVFSTMLFHITSTSCCVGECLDRRSDNIRSFANTVSESAL